MKSSLPALTGSRRTKRNIDANKLKTSYTTQEVLCTIQYQRNTDTGISLAQNQSTRYPFREGNTSVNNEVGLLASGSSHASVFPDLVIE
jgi:hypothetical protein